MKTQKNLLFENFEIVIYRATKHKKTDQLRHLFKIPSKLCLFRINQKISEVINRSALYFANFMTFSIWAEFRKSYFHPNCHHFFQHSLVYLSNTKTNVVYSDLSEQTIDLMLPCRKFSKIFKQHDLDGKSADPFLYIIRSPNNVIRL